MKNSIEEYRKTYNTILKIISENFNLKNQSRKRLQNEEIYNFLVDLNEIFEICLPIEKRPCAKVIKNKYIPLLNLMLKIDKLDDHKVKYLEILENAYRLAARYDFEAFLIYYEWESNDKLYEIRYKILNSYVYYLNEMCFDRDFELLIVNLPSGWGKTRIAKLYEAFRLGIDPTGTYLSLCSNDTVVKGGSRSVIDIIKDERYGNVFPDVNYQALGKDLFLKETDSEWKLKQCSMLATYYASTVNSNVVGQRASLSVHIDDLYADYKEALDENLNMYYYNKYTTVWRERFVQSKTPQVIVSGTMWSPTDFITKVIDLAKQENQFYIHPKFKYTLISEDRKKVIIQVPALDLETGESSCPELISTEKLLAKKRSMDTYLWETNFQQIPTTPEGLEFDWKNLKTYDNKPENIYGFTYAVIDGTRKSGKDYFSMPIYQNYYDDYALVDCIFTKTATSELIDQIVNKIIENKIIKLVIESNVDGGLKRTLLEKLNERGYVNIEIIEKYNTVQKSIRIESEKGNIRNRIWFPSKNMIEPNSDMSKFMNNFTLYNSSGRNRNDDAPDSNAMFSSEIIIGKAKMSKVKPIARVF